MKRKILYLTLGCIFTVIALACIQGYFIYNTYKLKEKEAHSAITQKLLKIETDDKLDSLNHAWMRKTGRFIRQYLKGEVSKPDYITLIEKTADTLSPLMKKYIQKEKLVDKYDVSYVNYVKYAVLVKDGKPYDTLYSGKLKLFGNNTEGAREVKASESSWRSNTDDLDYQANSIDDVDFEVVTERAYSISNWEREVLMKMSGLLIFSILLLVFVVVLFYISIKSLIRQRKIADIKTDFINNITHEFQTPIAALDIAVKTLQRKEGELSPEHYSNTLAIIGRQNQRMQKLFSQVKEASLTPEVDADTLQPLGFEDVTEIINDFRLSHPELVIHCTQSNENFMIRMDRFHLSTVLINLLDNSSKYGATQADITLGTTGKASIISVKDNGPGIAAKEQAIIFEKFYRVEKGNIHNTKGLGLGLFYVKSTLKAYKGEVNVNSEPGKGAEFIISIPL
jgi:two-component system phosphate regulon sensor histidine kinase PhoR